MTQGKQDAGETDLERRVRELEQSLSTHIAYSKSGEASDQLHKTDVRQELDKLWEKLDTHFVTMAEFSPVRLIAYGLVGTILLAVLGSIMSLIIKTAQ